MLTVRARAWGEEAWVNPAGWAALLELCEASFACVRGASEGAHPARPTSFLSPPLPGLPASMKGLLLYHSQYLRPALCTVERKVAVSPSLCCNSLKGEVTLWRVLCDVNDFAVAHTAYLLLPTTCPCFRHGKRPQHTRLPDLSQSDHERAMLCRAGRLP